MLCLGRWRDWRIMAKGRPGLAIRPSSSSTKGEPTLVETNESTLPKRLRSLGCGGPTKLDLFHWRMTAAARIMRLGADAASLSICRSRRLHM
jgi:hypothetical protein